MVNAAGHQEGADPSLPTLAQVVVRGLRRTCPRCGEGPLFRRWLALNTNCTVCGLALAPHPGDTWAFWVLGDRIFVAVAVLVVYLGVGPTSALGRGLLLAALVVPLLLTMRHRMGVCIGLDYLWRLRWVE